jgi:hypothetical protein
MVTSDARLKCRWQCSTRRRCGLSCGGVSLGKIPILSVVPYQSNLFMQ